MVATHTSDGNERIITDTDTTNRNFPHKLLTNREIPAIVQGIIPPVNHTTADGFARSRRDLHAVCAVLHKKIVTGATHSTTGVLKDPPVINWKDASGLIPVNKKVVVIPLRTNTQVLTGIGTSAPPIIIGSQMIEGPRRSIIPQEARNSEILYSSINRFPDEHRDSTPGWSKIIGGKVVTNKIANVYTRIRMNFGSDTVLSKNSNFMDFGLSPFNTTDKLGSIIAPDWIQHGHDIEVAAADRVSKMKAKNHYNFKSDFETVREIQYFERENISMSRPTLDSTPISTNITNGTTSPIDSIPVGAKTPDSMPLTQPTEFKEKNGKELSDS